MTISQVRRLKPRWVTLDISWAGPHGIGSHDGEGNSGQGEERSDCSCWGAFAELVLFPRGPVVLWADPLC